MPRSGVRFGDGFKILHRRFSVPGSIGSVSVAEVHETVDVPVDARKIVGEILADMDAVLLLTALRVRVCSLGHDLCVVGDECGSRRET